MFKHSHVDMCKGPNLRAAEDHADKSQYHHLMAKFYSLSREDQLVFMAMFYQIVENHENSKTNREGKDGKSTPKDKRLP